ncbi:class I SAM-dependent methyltransferase [Azospirillum sp. sgz301742]
MDGALTAIPDEFCSAPELVLLDRVHSYLERGVPAEVAVDTLVLGLRLIRSRMGYDAWQDFVGHALRHPLAGVIHSDPFTRRAYEKPRGYAGDAYLIDFIYGGECMPSEAKALTGCGKAIYTYTSSSPACAAVRERREIVARLIDAAAECREAPRILAIAGGHLREIHLSRAAADGRIGEWICLDQDAETLEFVRRTHAFPFVRTVNASIRRLIVGAGELGTFDLIYASGLYDYLPIEAAKRLTATAAGMLRPGGCFLFGNFAPRIFDQGYMESFMRWELIFRSEKELADIMEAVPNADAYRRETFPGANGNIVYGLMANEER